MDSKIIVERLEEALNARGNRALGDIIGEKETTISNWRCRRSKPKIDHLIANIGTKGVNLHWLLTGEGPMLLESAERRQHDFESAGRLMLEAMKLLLPKDHPPIDQK
ncbi:helix-turn-helix domain-containing protein [Chlorobium sp. N1]|uniref:helix-turn-helix domain-containing protein n=1 Tax=Chlorobium sp. N1 TaxID=2491138 RepID=UPI001038C2E8|nr:helix-turn-helix domain-containing protein [Chlorobium sp. N1]TCD47009.1 hypothetical protein E0L29_10255 [Chlorobium sp. N1]